MELCPLDAPFGTEVRGWDPGRELAADEQALLRSALHEHRLLLLRGHPVPTHHQLVALAASFGEVIETAGLYGLDLPDERVLLVSNELDETGRERGAAGSGAIPWHTDYAFMDRPAKESLLEAYRLPPSGGPATCFCDMYAAWDTLSTDLQERVAGLTAHHTLWAAGRFSSPVDDEERAARARQANPDLRYPDDGRGARHPVVQRHPETGRVSLYVSSFVSGFEGVGEEEGWDLLVGLLRHAEAPERVYCHQWEPGDLVVFDTIGTVHRRGPVGAHEPRTMRQLSTIVPLAGSHP